MKLTFIGLGAAIAAASCFGFVAVWQVPDDQPTPAQVTKMLEIMRKIADTNARSFARFANAHAVKAGKYSNVMTDYAKDFGGEIPINPCTDTFTGYTMSVSNDGLEAKVAAVIGKYCGKWTPKTYSLVLPKPTGR